MDVHVCRQAGSMGKVEACRQRSGEGGGGRGGRALSLRSWTALSVLAGGIDGGVSPPVSGRLWLLVPMPRPKSIRAEWGK